MKNYSIGIADGARTEFHQTLGLTGAEVSFNSLPAGVSVPFVHSHKENEEIYIITEGKGTLTIDGEVVKIKKGNVIKISPNGKRQFAAADDEGISYVCVQVKENSLTSYTENDGIIYYYVFQYSTGFAAASALAEKIVHGSQEDKDKYLDYLKAGNSDYPLNVIKKAGVDMEKEDYLNAAFAVFERRLDEFEVLVEKLGLA